MNNIGLNKVLLQTMNGTNAITHHFYNTIKKNNYYIIDYDNVYPDKISIKSIIFEINDINNKNDEIIHKYIDNIIFIVKINDNIIIKTPLSFFINFNEIKKYDNKIVLMLNNYFIYDYNLHNNDIIYSLKINKDLDNYIFNIKFLANVLCLTHKNKLKILNNYSKYF
jgi:hypothetical protein